MLLGIPFFKLMTDTVVSEMVFSDMTVCGSRSGGALLRMRDFGEQSQAATDSPTSNLRQIFA